VNRGQRTSTILLKARHRSNNHYLYRLSGDLSRNHAGC
jgi:hypothetical protein